MPEFAISKLLRNNVHMFVCRHNEQNFDIFSTRKHFQLFSAHIGIGGRSNHDTRVILHSGSIQFGTELLREEITIRLDPSVGGRIDLLGDRLQEWIARRPRASILVSFPGSPSNGLSQHSDENASIDDHAARESAHLDIPSSTLVQ